MIYLKDSATGVTVEDDGARVAFKRFGRPDNDQECVDYLSQGEADSLLRGLLRWKLAQIGGETAQRLTLIERMLGVTGDKLQ